MGKIREKILRIILNILSFPFIIFREMFNGVFEHENSIEHPADTAPLNVVRSESYRTLKRRNRLIRKFDHKKDV